MFGGHGVDIHGVRVTVSGLVLIVLALTKILVVSGSASHCGHELSPVIVEENGLFAPFLDGLGNSFHRHDSFNQFRFKGLLVEVDQDSMIGILF